MKKKRLDRDSWGFGHFPYYQMRVDIEGFHGIACLLELTDGEYCYWEMPIAGKMAVCGAGMKWLELIPDGKKRAITTKYLPDGRVSVWYVDVIENLEYDHDGVAVFTDKYLDVIFNPQGDVKIDDRDELDQAYESGELTKEQYEAALREGEEIVNELCADLPATEALCADILRRVTDRIASGEKPFKSKAAIMVLGGKVMEKQEAITLFHSIHPNFFEKENIQRLSEEWIFHEMLLRLEDFDSHKYEKTLDRSITFGFLEGNRAELLKAVEQVASDWVALFGEEDRVFCGYLDGKVASFCLVENMGTHEVNGQILKIGGPGCVGTLPAYRDKGIGLTMVKKVRRS